MTTAATFDHLVYDRRDGLLGETATATFSPCRTYRYALTRWWALRLPWAAFIMLNPSTADALNDDPTVRRCISFAQSWGAGGLVVLNLYALRATDPRELRRHPDPVGPDNDRLIASLLDGDDPVCCPVVCAWGAHPGTGDRAAKVLGLLRGRCARPLCLGTTKGGHPRHPLYVRGNTAAVDFAGVA